MTVPLIRRMDIESDVRVFHSQPFKTIGKLFYV